MTIISFSKYLLPTLALAMTPLALADEVPSDQVTVRDITYNGSGCPLGTVAENISPDNKAFTLTFSEFVAEAGPGISTSFGRRNCQLTIDLNVPQGWQFSLGSFDYRGYVFLDEYVQAVHATSYYFQGSGFTGRFSRTMDGELDLDYTYSDLIPIESLVWSSCSASRALNVNASIRVTNTDKANFPNAVGLITNDSIDGLITYLYGIRWRRC